MKKFKLTALAAAAAIGCSLIPQFAAVADNPAVADPVFMIRDFEDGQLPDTSGNLSAEIVSSPMGSSFVEIKTDDAYNALFETDKANHVLKLSAAEKGEENAVTLYDGTLPKDFAFDFSVLRHQDPDLSSFEIIVEQEEKQIRLIKYDGSNVFIVDDKKINDGWVANYPNIWIPNTMIFSNFASNSTKLTMYWQGRLNYTASAANPQTYDKAYFDLENYNGLNLENPVKIILKMLTTGDVYFDNFRLYRYENEITNEAGSDFEADTVGMAPMQNGIRTGGLISRGNYSGGFSAINYQTIVEKDPKNPSNKILKSTRGHGSDEQSFDSAVRYTVKKPKEKLEISFKALISDPDGFDQKDGWERVRKYDLSVDIADGTEEGVFFKDAKTTPADRILTFEDTVGTVDPVVHGQMKSSGSIWPPVYAGEVLSSGTTSEKTLNWEFGEWRDVKIEYDVAKGKINFNINGETIDVTARDDALIRTIMSSDEKDTVTVAILKVGQPSNMLNNYIMLDDVSIKSDGGNKEPEPTPTPTAEPTPTPTATPDIVQPERKEVVTAADSSHAGYFWDVTVDLSHDLFKGVFTSVTDNKTLEKTFEIDNMQGGNAVFSVILLDAPKDVEAKFTVE